MHPVLDGIDLLAAAFHAGDAHRYWRWMRRDAPVFHDERHDVWALTRHADVLAAARDRAVFAPDPTSHLGTCRHASVTADVRAAVVSVAGSPLAGRLAAEPAERARAVEEVLRWASPVRAGLRIVTRDVVLAGVRLRPGNRVVLAFAAANRDERVFTRPDDLRPLRRWNPHVGVDDDPTGAEVRADVTRGLERALGIPVGV